MLKKIFVNFLIDLKLYYTNILLICVPFFTIIALIIMILFKNPEFVKENTLLVFGISLINLILFGMACIVGFYIMKEVSPGETLSGKFFQEISSDLYSMFKIILKKVILIKLGFLILIPGIYFFIRWYFVYPSFVFEKNKNPFDRSMQLTREDYIFIFFLFLSFFLLLILSIFFGGLVNLFYNSISTTPDFSKIPIVLGSIVFFLFITPIIIIFDYEFYCYCKEKIGDGITGYNLIKGKKL